MAEQSALDFEEIKVVAIATLERFRMRDTPLWKPEKDHSHLAERIRREHLTEGTTLAEYNELIMNIINQDDSGLYLYYKSYFKQRFFVVGNGVWIVIFGEDLVMETAFEPDNYDKYLSGEGYYYLGRIEEVRYDVRK